MKVWPDVKEDNHIEGTVILLLSMFVVFFIVLFAVLAPILLLIFGAIFVVIGICVYCGRWLAYFLEKTGKW